MATRRAASSRKPTPHTAVMTRKMRRKPAYCQRLIISRPLAVSGPTNSTDMPNISGRRVPSEPRQATPNMAVGTDPSSRTSRVLWLISPSTAPATIPARTRAPTTSSRRCRMTPTATPRAGNTPLSTRAVTVLIPAERSRSYAISGAAMSMTAILAIERSRPAISGLVPAVGPASGRASTTGALRARLQIPVLVRPGAIAAAPGQVTSSRPSTAFPWSIGRRDLWRQGKLLIMAEPQLTPFEHLLIGLVCLSPASGYDLKRIFAVTPMGVYQPSSGSVYPALRRLEAKGLVKAVDQADEAARRRRVYEPTAAGRAAHADWLRAPVDASTVARDLGLHLMRFVMMEHAASREEVLGFLGNLKDALATFTEGLERYAVATGQLDDRHPGLALDHGLDVYRASLRWTRHTIAALRAAPVPSSEPSSSEPR